ncbi:homeobox-leucine zipper protein [Vigna unguiculata]|uniref:Homeobox-leucine zipper protein n=1 Tax=Vigna unguiculata TaxID=3917 RepID=A0A4D6KQI8_VIGUN|nr:homeobox-leucine zipper protein [Vigna unguiculata]
MEDAEECITGLCLGLGMGGYVPKKGKQKENRPVLDLAFELCPKGEAINLNHDKVESTDSDNSNTNNNNKGCRKKLRLSKDQSSMLENSFKLHTTLNPVQKQALADQLNLKTRQVEVWFQNRRARTKLKQTEVDREWLKKQCQNLSDENKRLKKELQELRALKVGPSSPLCIQLSKTATLTMCSSCDKLVKLNEGNNNIGLEGTN